MPNEIVERSVEVGFVLSPPSLTSDSRRIFTDIPHLFLFRALISRFEFLPLQNRQLTEEEKE